MQNINEKGLVHLSDWIRVSWSYQIQSHQRVVVQVSVSVYGILSNRYVDL